MINFPYHFARAEGRITRVAYQAVLPLILGQKIQPPRELDLEVFAYSGEEALPEQVASIRSFLRYAGRPIRFTVVSDGTYTTRSIELLQQVDPVIEVRECQPPSVQLSDKVQHYLSTHPTGKQLSLIMSLPASVPALYIDSDVLFFPGAADLSTRIDQHDAPAYYLADCQFSGDERFLDNPNEREDPVNTGTLLFFEKLDWSLGIERFLKLEGDPEFFSNQTMTHLTMHANGARALDPAKYVLQLDDQFIYRDRYANRSLAMRHYVNPVRHKFWTLFARPT